VIDDVAKLDLSRLPREFVAKASHVSGGVWIVADSTEEALRVEGRESGEEFDPAQGWSRVVARPDSFDWDEFRTTLSSWLSAQFTDTHAAWAYLGIPPRILFEEVLRETSGELARDYKVFVFHGKAQVVQTHTGRFGSHCQNMYLRDWTPLEVEFKYPCGPVEPEPSSLGEIIDVAEHLARDTDFVRVDLYAPRDRIVFGELTNYPDAGQAAFDPASFDDELGRWWTLPRRYRTLTAAS
jgi:TupA-like ATPgrasp